MEIQALSLAVSGGLFKSGEERSYHNIGNVYFSTKQFDYAVNNFVSGVGAFDTLRSLLKCEDHWKINLRQQHEEAYTALWRSLLMIGKIDEALFAAETCL